MYMLNSFVGCFSLRGSDEIKIYNFKKETFFLFSIHRIRNSYIGKNSNIALNIKRMDNGKECSFKTINLESDEQYLILNEKISSSQVVIKKAGFDDIQLFFTSEDQIQGDSFSFQCLTNPEQRYQISEQNDKHIQISDSINSIVTEIRRIKKSPNNLLLLCLILHSYYPFSFFRSFTAHQIRCDNSINLLKKILFVCFAKIKKEKVLDEFKKCIDYIDFQLSFENEISFGIGFFIVTFLNFFQNKLFDLTKFLFMKQNFVYFLFLLNYLSKPVGEVQLSQMMSPVLEPYMIERNYDDFALSSFYQFLLINCAKYKSQIYFHFTYLSLFSKISAPGELDFFLNNNNVIGIENFVLSKSFFKPKIEIKKTLCLDYENSPFEEIDKKDKIKNLELHKSFEFEKNEQFKPQKYYNRWFKLKLAKHKKKLCRYQPINISPEDNVEEDSSVSMIYILISIFCLLLSFVVFWKFACC